MSTDLNIEGVPSSFGPSLEDLNLVTPSSLLSVVKDQPSTHSLEVCKRRWEGLEYKRHDPEFGRDQDPSHLTR